MNTMLNVWWMVREDTKVNAVKADSILEKFGFSGFMGDLNERKAVRRGIDELHNRRGKNRRVVERVRETADSAVFGVLKMNIDENSNSAEYDQDTTVVLDKATGTVEATGVMADVVNRKIAENRGVYNGNDLRFLFINVIREAGGICKRPTGGVYLVPAMYADKILSLKAAVLEMCDKGAVIYTERIYDGEEERSNAAEAVTNDLSGRVNLIVTAVSRIQKLTCRIKSHQDALVKIEELTEMYKTILGEQVGLESLTDTLKAASAKVETILAKTMLKA